MGKRVSGIPDVRFPSYSERNKTVEVVTVAEVSGHCSSLMTLWLSPLDDILKLPLVASAML